ALDQYWGQGPEQMAAWLRQILARTIANAARDLGRQKRDVGRERSLEAELEESSCRLEAWLCAEDSSPSERAERNERLLQLGEALARLPEAQREALLLKYCQGWSLEEVANHLGRSAAATASLLQRGLASLRRLLREEGEP